MNSKLSERVKVIWGNIDPSTKDTLTPDSQRGVTRCIDVSGYNSVMCILFRTVGTGSIQAASLYAATSVAGAGLTAITSVGSTEATKQLATAGGTIGNPGLGMIVLEAKTSDIESTLAGAKFVAVKASFATETDELGVCWILSDPRVSTGSLTATGSNTQ